MLRRALAAAFALSGLAPAPAAAAAGGEPVAILRDAVRSARDRVYPALVHIQPVFDTFVGGKKQLGTSTGSGVVIDAAGHVMTNHHVAGDARRLLVTLSDKSRVQATLVGSDPMTDIAVVRLDLTGRTGPPLPVADLGDSDSLEVGDWVLAMGSPLSLARSLSLGVVSCVDRYLDPLQFDDPDERTGLFNTWIQTDAAINPGNSGGPLVDLAGRVVGINARKLITADNVGFAIPINVAKVVAAELIAHGRVERSAIGIHSQPLPRDDRGALDHRARGVLIASVHADSPAEAGGVRAGDILIEYDGVRLSALFDEELPAVRRVLASPPVGKAISVVVERGGEEARFQVVTEDYGRFSGEEVDDPLLGVTLKGITQAMARERRLASTEGVIVTGVQVGGPAHTAEPRLRDGDVLLEMGGHGVTSLADLKCAEEACRDRLAAGVVVKIRRQRDLLWSLLRADPDARSRKGA
jgi:serine protease Do